MTAPAAALVGDGDRIRPGDIALVAHHLEGHPRAPLFRSTTIRREPHLFTGRCLFPRGVGAASGAPAAFAGLLNGTESAVFGRLPDTAWVYPDRGRDTTVGAERPHLPKRRGAGPAADSLPGAGAAPRRVRRSGAHARSDRAASSGAHP